MAYRTLFFDADNTLFDFDLSEKTAFKRLTQYLDYKGDPESFFRTYQDFNGSLWRALEEQKIDKSQIPTERFKLLFDHFSLIHDPVEIGQVYLTFLGQETHLISGALDLIKTLADTYQLAIVTNGIEQVQKSRMSRSPIQPYFEQVIISEAIGCAKPDPAFFTYALEVCSVTDKSQVLVIGDSLSSDILGGIRSGLDTCWYNPKGLSLMSNATPTFEVTSFESLLQLLESR